MLSVLSGKAPRRVKNIGWRVAPRYMPAMTNLRALAFGFLGMFACLVVYDYVLLRASVQRMDAWAQAASPIVAQANAAMNQGAVPPRPAATVPTPAMKKP